MLTACASVSTSAAADSPTPPPNYQAPELVPPTQPGSIAVPANEMLGAPGEWGGVTLEPPQTDALVGVTSDQVLKIVDRTPGPNIAVLLALATTDAGKDISTGYRPIDHRLVWWVRETDTCQMPIGGGPPTMDDTSPTPVPTDKDGCPRDANHEDNALVDPITGQMLVGYTYR
jgi:hypothetical protein